MINIQNVKHLATALLGSVSISAHALSGTMEFTGAFGLNDNTYDANLRLLGRLRHQSDWLLHR